MRRRGVGGLTVLAMAAGLAFSGGGDVRAQDAVKGSEYEKGILKWREERAARLKKPDGWLSVVGLEWLSDGDNVVGSAAGAKAKLPASAPARVGVIELKGRALRFRPAEGAGATIAGKSATEMALLTDRDGEPTTVQVGSVSFFAIERGGRFGLRIKDRESAGLKHFRGIDSFPVDPKWKVEGRWEPYATAKKVKTSTVIGTVEEENCPGAAVFEIAGKSYRLEPVLEEGSDELFFVFGDATNGQTTYGGGRFLYAPMPKNGKITLDFNRAYNPPCVFTDWATCPVPRRENRIGARIEAGEKGYRGGAHH